MILVLLAAATASVPPHGTAPLPRTEAQSVIDRQRRQPPRAGRAAGLSPEEASLVMTQYLGSIGKRLQTDTDPGGPHP